MNGELERMWKEAVVTFFRYYLGICLDGLRKIMKNLRIAGHRAEIWTRDLRSTKKEC
jgi:hypothetical protein